MSVCVVRSLMACVHALRAPVCCAGAARRFITDFSSGKKCTSQVKLSADTDWSRFTARQLKDIIKEKGIDCKGCAERSDFERRLREYVGAPSA